MGLESLRADLEEARRAKPVTFAQWLDVTDTETVELVMSYIRDETIMVDALVSKLRRNDVPITRETIMRERG